MNIMKKSNEDDEEDFDVRKLLIHPGDKNTGMFINPPPPPPPGSSFSPTLAYVDPPPGMYLVSSLPQQPQQQQQPYFPPPSQQQQQQQPYFPPPPQQQQQRPNYQQPRQPPPPPYFHPPPQPQQQQQRQPQQQRPVPLPPPNYGGRVNYPFGRIGENYDPGGGGGGAPSQQKDVDRHEVPTFRDPDQITERGGHIFQFWNDLKDSFYGLFCMPCQTTEALNRLKVGSVGMNFMYALLLQFNLCTWPCLATQTDLANRKMGGQSRWITYACSWFFCPWCTSCQLSRASKKWHEDEGNTRDRRLEELGWDRTKRREGMVLSNEKLRKELPAQKKKKSYLESVKRHVLSSNNFFNRK